MNHRRFSAELLLTLCLGMGLSNADVKPIDISSFANNTWCAENGGVVGCSAFPFGTKHYDAITYRLPGNKNGTANNAWFASEAAGGGSGVVSITIPVNVANAKTVYTLMNTEWGSTGSGLFSITFTGTGGATWTFNPIGGTNIRDYNNGNFTNSCICQLPGGKSQSATINAWTSNSGSQRLDEQIFELPASFAGQTLVSITITDSGNQNVQRSFLAALSVFTTAP